MTELFAFIVSLSLKGGIAALLVWLVCRLLHRLHAPRQLCRLLWLAVLVRMVCPVGIPVALPRETPAPVQAAVQWEETALGDQADALSLEETPAQAPSLPSPAQLLALGWGAGAAGLLVLALWDGRKMKKRVALAYRTPEGFYTGDGVDTPFVWGLLRPRVYLPGKLDSRLRPVVLAHEQNHIRQLDFLLKPLCYAVVCLHWFNPLAWLAYRQFTLESEAACDQAALVRLDPTLRGDYCAALVEFALAPSLTLQPLALGQSNVKARVKTILTHKRPAFWALGISLVLAVAMGLACFAQPARTPEAPAAQSPVAQEQTPAQEQAPAQESVALALPLEQYDSVSCRYGNDDTLGTFHKGLDLAAQEGTPVLAAAAGTVTCAQNHWSYGNFVEVDHGNGLVTLYAHLDTLTVKEGDSVAAGQQLGTVGRTGNATGLCLHFEVRDNGQTADPENYLTLK